MGGGAGQEVIMQHSVRLLSDITLSYNNNLANIKHQVITILTAISYLLLLVPPVAKAVTFLTEALVETDW